MAMLAIKAALLFLLAFGITGLMRRFSASARHLVWLAAFCGVFLLPLGRVLPALAVRFPSFDHVPVAVTTANDEPVVVVVDPPLRAAREARIAALDARPKLARRLPMTYAYTRVATTPAVVAGWPWTTRFLLLWITGAVMVGAAFAVAVLRTHLLACEALPAGGLVRDEADVIAASLGITRDVRVLVLPGATMPMTWGFRRPVVLLPEDAQDWPAARRREVLTHELAHVQRADWLVRLLAAVVCAFYWFNPLAWLAARRLRDEQELACDDTVLAEGALPSDYAAHLLEVARSLRTPRGVVPAAVAMARPSQLSDRLLALLDETRARSAGATRWMAGAAALAALAIAMPLGAMVPASEGPRNLVAASVGPVLAQAIGDGIEAGVRGGVGAGVSGDMARARKLATAAIAPGPCPDGSRRDASHSHSESNSHTGNNTYELMVSNGSCVITVRFVGNVTFSDEGDAIENVPQGSWIRVTEEGNGPDKRFDATWRGGQLERHWRVDGAETPETGELRTWLATTLHAALTRTGYNAVPRALHAYRAAGIDSVLRLSSATGSDYVTRTMLQAVIDSNRVPASAAARIASAASDMSSDYEKAELLITIARKVGLDAQVQDAMAEAAVNMSSDYERRRVLTAALERNGLSAEAAASVLRAAERMGSDFEKAELLITYLAKQPLDAARRPSFFRAVGSMSSDYEHRRVLAAVVARPENLLPIVPDLTAQAEHINSDYERAELLVALARRVASDGDARARIRHAADGIGSDYEKNRVLAELGRAQ